MDTFSFIWCTVSLNCEENSLTPHLHDTTLSCKNKGCCILKFVKCACTGTVPRIYELRTVTLASGQLYWIVKYRKPDLYRLWSVFSILRFWKHLARTAQHLARTACHGIIVGYCENHRMAGLLTLCSFKASVCTGTGLCLPWKLDQSIQPTWITLYSSSTV